MSEATAVRVRSFQGLQNLPIVAALRRGVFTRAGLDVALTFTNSSAEQLGMLARGEADLIHTAPDNVVNFDAQPAAFGCDPATAPRVSLLLGGSNGPLSVYALPTIEATDGLRGRAIGVDNPGSGFALALRAMLEPQGLRLGDDYTFVTAGGTGLRARALAQGKLDATLVYPPFDLLLEQEGCHCLAISTDVFVSYASQALAGAQPWVEAHSDLVTRYIAALLDALAWLHAPGERGAVERLLAEEPALGATDVSPAQAYAAFTDPRCGFGREAALDPTGLALVIALRARYGNTPAATLGAPADYCDLRWYARARASRP